VVCNEQTQAPNLGSPAFGSGAKKLQLLVWARAGFKNKNKNINEKNAFFGMGASRCSLGVWSFGGRQLIFFQGADG
jgi:hypothetical protein